MKYGSPSLLGGHIGLSGSDYYVTIVTRCEALFTLDLTNYYSISSIYQYSTHYNTATMK